MKSLDDRLGVLEYKFRELTEENNQGRATMQQKMVEMGQQIEELGMGFSKVDGRFDELKQLIVSGQHSQKKGEESPTAHSSTTEARSGSESKNNYREEVPFTSGFTTLYTTTTPVISMVHSHTQPLPTPPTMGFTQPHSLSYNP